MMSFRTEVFPERSDLLFDHNSLFLLIGSCFSEEIGGKLLNACMARNVNPSGISYNPFSIGRCLEDILEKREYKSSDLFQHNDLWHSFQHHGSFSAEDPKSVLSKINSSIEQAHHDLNQADLLIITFGTALAYRYKKDQVLVANCHKVPNREFEREMIDQDSIVKLYSYLIPKLSKLNKELQILLTVSPVRHWKNGYRLNQISKSHLQLATNRLANDFDQVSYFPSYEILMDDLRDYRFYKDDLLHPNELAVKYIWDKFRDYAFSPDSNELSRKMEKVTRILKHRPLHRDQVEADRQVALEKVHKNLTDQKFDQHIERILRDLKSEIA